MKIILSCSLVVASSSCNISHVFINFFQMLTKLFTRNKYATNRTVWACAVRTNYLYK
jgi:hypothetical protein